MLIPESKDEKAAAYLARFERWSAGLSDRDRALFCSHGRYVGYRKALAFMCPGCSAAK